MEYFLLAIGILLAGALFVFITKEEYKLKICTIFSFLGLATVLFPSLWCLYFGNSVSYTTKKLLLFGEITFMIDQLSAIFILVISIMSFLGVIYANGYLKPYLKKNINISAHCFFLMILIAAMLSVTAV